MSSTRIILRQPSGYRGPKGDKGDPGASGGGGVGPGVAAGGTAGQVLTKSDGTDYHTGWTNAGLPTGGTTGQVLKKTSGTSYATAWADESGGGGTGVPDGGTIGQSLFKNSGTDGDADWKDTGVVVHALTSKTTPVDTDELSLSDSAATNAWKRLTMANLKAWVKAQVSVSQLAAPAAALAMNGQQITGGADGVADTDFATVGQVGDATTGLFDSASDVTTAIPGLTITVVYDNTLGWVLPTGFGTNANVAWEFDGGDESHAPPSTTSTRRRWNRPAS